MISSLKLRAGLTKISKKKKSLNLLPPLYKELNIETEAVKQNKMNIQHFCTELNPFLPLTQELSTISYFLKSKLVIYAC